MATRLISIYELSVWARQDIDPADPFAAAVIEASSLLVMDTAQHPEWTSLTVPSKAKLICTQLAKRTFLNPDAIIAEGGIGPIGGDRFVEDFARTLELTDAEIAMLEGLRGDPLAPKKSGLWIQGLDKGEPSPVVFINDSSGSDWAIPYLDTSRDPYYYPMAEDVTT